MEGKRLRHQLGIFLTACVVIVTITAGPAEGQPAKELTINYIETDAAAEQFANQVRVYATVTAGDENPILGLSSENFEVLEDGRKVAVDNVSTATDPMAIVLAIDTSGSMQARDTSGQTSMAAAKMAAVNFISMLTPDDRVALFSFNNEPTLEMEFSENHEAAISAVRSLAAKPNAATCLYDTAVEVVKKAAEIPRGRRAIILLTDGKDERAGSSCSMHTANDVIDVATTKSIRVPIYTIGVGPKVDARKLARIASFTGGRNLLAGSLADLQVLYAGIANQLKSQYLISYITRSPSGEHTLVLKVRHEGARGQDEKRFWSPPLPAFQPLSIRFIGPDTAQPVKGTVEVKTDIEPEGAVAKVRYYVNGSLKKEFATAPFTMYQWDTAGLPGGLHILRVEAIDINGRSGSAEMTLNVAPPRIKPVKSAPPPATEASEGQAAKPGLAWIAGLVLLLAFAGGCVGWFFLRKKRVPAETDDPDETMLFDERQAEDIEDETVLMPDKQYLQAIPPASVSIVKSESLEAGKSFDITGIARVGRSKDNNICIPDKSVSRQHGEIFFEDGEFYIRDSGSKSGIKVDGKGVLVGGTTLRNGAKIQLAPKTILVFHSKDLIKEIDADDMTRIYND
jgi:VWFA-related protein